MEKKLCAKRPRNGSITVELSPEEIEELTGAIAAEANHTKDRDLENALDELFEHFSWLEDECKWV